MRFDLRRRVALFVAMATGLAACNRTVTVAGRVRRVALEFFSSLDPEVVDAQPFVVMRAVDVPAARRNQGGLYNLKSFGVVLERRSDGRWYMLGDSLPARM